MAHGSSFFFASQSIGASFVMSSHHAQPDRSGQHSPERTPQVVVRAGKCFVCSSCGVMVEIPADVVGQMVVVAEQPTNEATEDEPTAERNSNPPKLARRVETPRPHSAEPSNCDAIAFRKIDGLRVPTGGQLSRALGWVGFQLKVLDRQGSELARLEKLLNKRARKAASCSARRAPAKTRESQTPQLNAGQQSQSDAPTMVSKPDSPKSRCPKERGPP